MHGSRTSTLLWLPVLLLFFGSDVCATDSVRIATYNVQDLGSINSTQWTALSNVVQRMDADILLVQEVDKNETGLVSNFASANGYPYYRTGGIVGTLTGNLQNAVLSRYPIISHVAWTSVSLSGDGAANDLTRTILQVVVSHPDVCAPIGCFSIHAKAGTSSVDNFRRAIEITRLGQAVANFKTSYPDGIVLIGGDLNEDLGDSPFGQTFTSLPSGLPQTYKLGNDISFPVVYDPFTKISSIGGLGLFYADATHEDNSIDYSTRTTSSRRLDYIWRPFTVPLLGDEVHDTQDDNGIDDGPLGNYLYKSGGVLNPADSGNASDHYPVMTDVLMSSCDGTSYGFGSAADHLLTPRCGIRGSATIGDGSFGFLATYAKANVPVILVLGQARLSPPFGTPLTPHVPGGYLHVSLAGLLGLFPGQTDSEGQALLPLPLPNIPGIVGLSLNAQWFIADTGSPNGVGAMTDAYEVVIHS